MKYLLFLILSSCAVKTTVTRIYNCAIFNPHGVYAHLNVSAFDEETAVNNALEVTNRLITNRVIPDNCAVMCEPEEK